MGDGSSAQLEYWRQELSDLGAYSHKYFSTLTYGIGNVSKFAHGQL